MDPVASTPGTPFGRYRLLSLIGTGDMGEIYLASGPGVAGVEKRLAIKKLLPALADDPGFVARFLDEARLVVTLSHGNIVPVFEAGRVGSEYFLAMEYVEGCNLRDLAARASERALALPIPLALFIAHEVSRGLGYAHRKADPEGRPLRLIHRDVSPQNVLVGFDGEVRLVDFGIAKAAGKSQRTLTGGLMGKLAFMSPEQAMGLPLDARSDVFSLGVVLHEMLTGRPLFDGETDPEVLRRVQEAQVEAPSKTRAEVTPELDSLVQRMLARDPGGRQPRMAEVTQAVGRLLYADHPAGASEMAEFLATLVPHRLTPKADGFAPGVEALPAARHLTPSMPLPLLAPVAASSPPPRAARLGWAALLLVPVAAALGYAARIPPGSAERAPTPGPVAEKAESRPAPLPSSDVPALTTAPVLAAAPTPAPQLAPAAIPLRPAAPAPALVSTAAPPTSPRPPVEALVSHRPRPEAKPAGPVAAHGPSAVQGFLSLRVTPWGEVLIDGTRVAETSALVRHPLAAGAHQVLVRNTPLGKEQKLEVTIAAGGTEVRRVDLTATAP